MAIYDRQIATALRLVSKYGSAVSWIKTTAIIADPSKPWTATNGAVTTHDSKMLILSRYRDDILFKYFKGTDIPTGRTFGLIGEQVFTPAISDRIVTGNDNYAVKSVNYIAPNGRPILYIIELEK